MTDKLEEFQPGDIVGFRRGVEYFHGKNYAFIACVKQIVFEPGSYLDKTAPKGNISITLPGGLVSTAKPEWLYLISRPPEYKGNDFND